jgi:EAL domain-containing protein (putative c-di-GMP-specific phosphodiesterase class I)
MKMALLQAHVPVESGDAVLRARHTAALTRVAVGLIGMALLLLSPSLLPHATLGIAGFAAITLTSLVQIAAPRIAWLTIEETASALSGMLITGFGSEHVGVLNLLWLVAIASGVLARGGRVHWLGRTIVLCGLALPAVRHGVLHAEYVAFCAGAIALLLTSGRLTTELNVLLRQARVQADNAETLLFAGDIAARMSDRSARVTASALPSPGAPVEVGPSVSRRQRAQLVRAIAGEGLSMVVQPIVDVRTGTVHAYESLVRFSAPGMEGSPLPWFSVAERIGERAALERACLRLALELFTQRPPGTKLSVNLSAPVLVEPTTMSMLERAGGGAPRDKDLSGLIVEITEETLVSGEAALQDAFRPLRERGAELAVDDMGAGYSGLRQITTVRPGYLKLDKSLVAGIDRDHERAALVGALAGYSAQVGSLLVVEGVETEGELRAVRKLGVPLVQGYYVGRPGAPWPGVDPAAEPAVSVAPVHNTRAVARSGEHLQPV